MSQSCRNPKLGKRNCGVCKLTAKRPKKAADAKRIQHCGRNQQQQEQPVYKSSTVRLLNEPSARMLAGWLQESAFYSASSSEASRKTNKTRTQRAHTTELEIASKWVSVLRGSNCSTNMCVYNNEYTTHKNLARGQTRMPCDPMPLSGNQTKPNQPDATPFAFLCPSFSEMGFSTKLRSDIALWWGIINWIKENFRKTKQRGVVLDVLFSSEFQGNSF